MRKQPSCQPDRRSARLPSVRWLRLTCAAPWLDPDGLAALLGADSDRGGYVDFDMDRQGWVVWLLAPEREEYRAQELEQALAWCLGVADAGGARGVEFAYAPIGLLNVGGGVGDWNCVKDQNGTSSKSSEPETRRR